MGEGYDACHGADYANSVKSFVYGITHKTFSNVRKLKISWRGACRV